MSSVDEKGNKVEKVSYNSDGSLDSKYTYKIKFDSKGNWVNRVELTNTIPTEIAERKIEYYD